MNQFTWNDYKEALENQLLGELPNFFEAPDPKMISTDSRESVSGKIFLPLKGEVFDGHSFIENALTKGAEASFCEYSYQDKIPKQFKNRIIFVKDTLLSLQKIAHYIRRQNQNTKSFAITGSVGKTSTKNILSCILTATKEKTLTPLKNFNNEIGVPLTILKLEKDHKYAVLEMGARQRGDISLLKNIAQPNFNVCLCVGSSHIGVFGGQENIYKAKLEIIQKLHKDDKNLVLGDDPTLVKLAKLIDSNCYTFGYSKTCDAVIIEESISSDKKLKLKFKLLDKTLNVTLQTVHKSLAKNALAASFLAYLAGISLETIAEGLKNFQPTDSRFKEHKINNSILIDDSYNASLESMCSGIETLEILYPKKNTTLVLGDMLELGSYSDELHEKLANFCQKKTTFYKIITIGDAMEKAFQSLQNKNFFLEHFKTTDDFLKTHPTEEKLSELIYLKASNSIRLDKIINHYTEQKRTAS